MTRRDLLLSVSALAATPMSKAQAAKPAIPAQALNHLTLRVSDAKRSIEFYQGLFGMPIQSRQSNSVQLRIGAGSQHVGVSAASNEKPGIDHFCMTTGAFNVDSMRKIRGFQHSKSRAAAERLPPDGVCAAAAVNLLCGTAWFRS